MKIDQLTALAFPETLPTFAGSAHLLLLLDGLVHFRPTESTDTPAAPFAGTGLLQSYAPSAVGANLDLFLRMIKDLRGHAAEYSSGFLASLSPAMAASYQEESVRQLISAMTGKDGGQAEAPAGEGLWRTRLLLQLAEEMLRDELEIADHLAKVNAMKQHMLDSLRGDDDEEEELPLPSLPSPPARIPIRDDLLCRAWCRLFLTDRNERRPLLAATANIEAAELLMDTYTQLRGRGAVPLCVLALPDLSGMAEAEYLANRAAFRAAAAPLLAEIGKTIETARQDGQAPPLPTETVASWQAALAEHFPGAAAGAFGLQISLLADATLADLCRNLGKSDAETAVPGAPHTVLVHHTPRF
ncbi:MAG: hypothetical protein OEV73_11995 [Desulfobulbaceae bacterium]|nr:hypothetical protein [Desulfobulbaceae bacterium]